MIKNTVLHWIDENKEVLTDMAQNIWTYAEECLNEHYAATLQKEYLRSHGFQITEYPNIPTAFVAEYGNGKPILGVLGEYDALKNLSQEVSCEKQSIQEGAPGHGCGHNLLGVGCIGAAMAIKQAIEKKEIQGTIRYYGCPAEEMLLGKVLLAKEKAFDDLDACLTWHPSCITMPWAGSLLSLYSAQFQFSGKSAHAGAAPHLGRSALDAVELMNTGANFMREHVEEENRIHYIITNGGIEPNSVPATAEVWYNVRAPKKVTAKETFTWLTQIAKGAAMMTQTKLEKIQIISGCYELRSNQTLVNLIEENMREIGVPVFTDEDRTFAKNMSILFDASQKRKALESNFVPLEMMKDTLHEGIESPHDVGKFLKASTDVGDVSNITPLAMFGVATWPLGVVAHTWQSTAASGSSMGMHGMHYAAKVLAAALVDLYTKPEWLQHAKQEFVEAAEGKPYVSVFEEDFES